MSARAQLEAAERAWATPATERPLACERCGTALYGDREVELRQCYSCRRLEMLQDSEGMFEREAA